MLACQAWGHGSARKFWASKSFVFVRLAKGASKSGQVTEVIGNMGYLNETSIPLKRLTRTRFPVAGVDWALLSQFPTQGLPYTPVGGA